MSKIFLDGFDTLEASLVLYVSVVPSKGLRSLYSSKRLIEIDSCYVIMELYDFI